MRERLLTALICTALLTSMIPAATASGPSDSLIWGISYDWANLDDDQETLTGVSPAQTIADLEEAARLAKFDLDALSVISGNTFIFVEQWEDDGTTSVDDAHGNSHTVSTRHTEITLRHGTRNDQGLVTNWEDDNSSIDIWYRAEQTSLAVFDVAYTEYLDSQMRHIGADLSMTGSVSQDAELELEIELAGGGESYDADVEFGLSFGVTVDSITSEWRVGQPIDFLGTMSYDDVYEEWPCRDDCGMVSGDYSVSAEYEFSSAGVPLEQLGLPADALDISISDSVTSAGAFFEDFDTAIYTSDRTPACNGLNPSMDADLGLGPDVEVQCRQVLPIFSPGLLGMAGVSMASAFTDSSAFEAAAEELSHELETIAGDLYGEYDDNNSASGVFVCDDGTEIPEYWVNDGEEDCAGGEDEYGIESTGVEAMAEAWAESDLEQTIETFFEVYYDLMDDHISNPALDIENACITTLWDSSEKMVVGVAWMHDGYMMVGPDIEGVGDHSVDFGIEYLVGDAARTAQAAASDLDSLVGLAPPSQHDARDVDELLGIEDEDGVFVPGVGVMMTLGLLGAAALSQRREE